MVSDKHVESNHRKHRRSFSPSDEVFKSPKRHKSRHHHRRHGHRHHRDEEVQYNDDENVNGGDLDMEEGEILGKEGIGETLKKKLESVDEFVDIKSGQFRENNLGRNQRRERECEKRKEIEPDRERRKERGSVDRDSRGDREKDYLRDRDNDRGRSRDKARYSSRERGRENERERRSEKDRDKGREFQSDREKHKSLDDGYGEVRHKHSGHSRHDAEDDLELRSPTSVNGHDPNSGDVKETRGNVERTRIDNDDKGDVVVWEVEQEDEELNLIEESRRRTQAIMEKYKKKLEQQNGFSSHDLELANIPKQSSTVADVLGSGTLGPVTSAVNQAKAGLDIDAVDGEVAKLSSAVGESPAQLVISDSDRTLASTGLGEGSPKDKISDDMFTDDIFGESPADSQKMGYLRGKGNGIPIVRSGLDDNWDDAEGYYSYQLGELLDDRYEIMATHGKGVFSTVVRAKDTKAELGEPEEVAIKIIRNNETMHKAGQTEIQILKKLAGSDPENKRHCVRFLSTFKYRNHLCLVFESLHLNLREIVKKYGRNIGIQLSGVRVYATQLFISLKHLKNCGVLHCDIKPDNMLVNEGRNTLKLCDFGSAMFAGTNEVTPYLVSRFYRAPEIILGLPYDHPLDIWSVGCCLYELFSGKIMFPGSTNNEMLRLHMELKGAFPKKMLRKGAFIDQHIDKDLCFYATEEDSVTRKTTKRMMVNIKPKEFGSVIKQRYKDEDSKLLVHFRDLLDRIFILDPQKRITVSQALAHPFITGK
ncbi:unnamed protein product [Arabidopsis thaliana]|uniref:Serine/threonine-protein kinase PRP4 homolog n=1 Tax=Arabidopsis thaliana TaxID=3702 RepID=A0A654EA95_ARATH|nr:unnamed protein product [Arabidopsis thaliana]